MTTNLHKGKRKGSTVNEIYREDIDTDKVFMVQESWNESILQYTLSAGVVSPVKREWGNGVISYSNLFVTEAPTKDELPKLKTYTTKGGYEVKEEIHHEKEFKAGDYDMMTVVTKPFFRRVSVFNIINMSSPKELTKYL